MDTPFLARGREHAVRWRDWGDEAFAEAKRAGKPLFVLSGASWCTASALLDAEAFSDPGIAKRLNEGFIPVRVDREARPDIDDRLQALTQAATNQAGWPLAAFLTPDGGLFHAGTRFSRNTVGGRPPLAEILDRTSAAFSDNPSRAAAFAGRIMEEVRTAAEAPRGTTKERSGRKTARVDLAPFLAAHDARHGGFAGAPKFPLPLAFEALAACGTTDKAVRQAVHAGITSLARSPLHDHVGGGFYRLSRNEDWEEPVCEKRLGDNADLLSLFTIAFREQREPAFRSAALGILRWGEETHGTSQPAGEAGRPWTGAELNRVLSRDERVLLCETVGARRNADDRITARDITMAIRTDPAIISKRLRKPPAQIESDLARVFAKLADVRKKSRPAPSPDATPLTSPLARMGRALITSGGLLGQPEVLAAGVSVIDRLTRETITADGTVLHAAGDLMPVATPIFAADHAQLGLALLAAHAASHEARHLATACRIAERMVRTFRNGERGGFHDIDPASADSFCRRFPLHPVVDLPDPSANGIAALFLARLGKASGAAGDPFLERARETVAAFPKAVELYGPFAGSLALAALETAHPGR